MFLQLVYSWWTFGIDKTFVEIVLKLVWFDHRMGPVLVDGTGKHLYNMHYCDASFGCRPVSECRCEACFEVCVCCMLSLYSLYFFMSVWCSLVFCGVIPQTWTVLLICSLLSEVPTCTESGENIQSAGWKQQPHTPWALSILVTRQLILPRSSRSE